MVVVMMIMMTAVMTCGGSSDG